MNDFKKYLDLLLSFHTQNMRDRGFIDPESSPVRFVWYKRIYYYFRNIWWKLKHKVEIFWIRYGR